MTRRSPLTVTYSSLLQLAEEVLKESQYRYEKAKGNGVVHLDPLASRVENAWVLVKMLKKCEPGRQTDMLALFREVVK
jgi:hypothetical protein